MTDSPLNQILALMKDGQAHSRESLCEALGTTAAMADMMLDQLIRLGCLEEIGGQPAQDLCTRCGRSRDCPAPRALCPQGSRALLLTPKGHAACSHISSPGPTQ